MNIITDNWQEQPEFTFEHFFTGLYYWSIGSKYLALQISSSWFDYELQFSYMQG